MWTSRAKKAASRRASAAGAAGAHSGFLRGLLADRAQRLAGQLDLPLQRSRAGAALDPLRLQRALAPQHLVEGAVELLAALPQVLLAQLRERDAALDRVADQAADDPVRLAERHAPAHEQVGDLGRREHLVARGLGQPLAVEGDPGEHPLGRVEAALDRLDRVEQRLLVLLHVLAVGQRQRVHRPQQREEVGGDARALGAQQLGRVGVLLLRHDRGARGERLVELAEAELRGAPDDDLRAEPREVHRADRGGRQVVEHEVAVRGAVDRVGGDVGEPEVVGDGAAVELPVDARQRARAERHHPGAVEGEIEAHRVAGEHPEVGEQVVAEVDRLGALQVGVAGHRPVAVRLGQLEQPRHRRPRQLDRAQRMRLDEHRDVGRHLVVARAPGVQLAGQRADLFAEQPLDRHVDVLVGGLEGEARLADPRPHVLQAGFDPLQLVVVEHAELAQRPRVRLRLVDVVRGQPRVELDRAVEAPEAQVGLFAEA